jgi:hypothetical protein
VISFLEMNELPASNSPAQYESDDEEEKEQFETVEGLSIQSNVATPFYSYHMDKTSEHVRIPV